MSKLSRAVVSPRSLISTRAVIVVPIGYRFDLFPHADRVTVDMPLPSGHVLRMTMGQAGSIGEESFDLQQEIVGICPRSGEPY